MYKNYFKKIAFENSFISIPIVYICNNSFNFDIFMKDADITSNILNIFINGIRCNWKADFKTLHANEYHSMLNVKIKNFEINKNIVDFKISLLISKTKKIKKNILIDINDIPLMFKFNNPISSEENIIEIKKATLINAYDHDALIQTNLDLSYEFEYEISPPLKSDQEIFFLDMKEYEYPIKSNDFIGYNSGMFNISEKNRQTFFSNFFEKKQKNQKIKILIDSIIESKEININI